MNLQNIDWSLYAIIDQEWLSGRDIQWITEQMIQGGAGIIQYRNKVSEDEECYQEARKIMAITQEHHVPFILNDRVDIALAVDADGVHIGKDDVSLTIARKMLGNDKIIGFSVKSESDYRNAKTADYLGIGAIYPTTTKKDYPVTEIKLIQKIRKQTSIPIIGIGGITLENLTPVIQSGANGIAVISALLGAEHIKNQTLQFVRAVKQAKKVDSSN